MTTRIAASAVVEDDVSLGEGTVIWDLSQVRRGAVLGRACTIGRNVFIDTGVRVGDRCKIQNNALVYAPAVVHDGVFIGPGAVLTNDRNPRAVTPELERKDAEGWTANGIVVEEGAALGAGSVVVAGTRVGAWALVAAGAVVVRDVPPHALVAGVPARQIGWVSHEGHRLEPDDDGFRCPSSGARYVLRDGNLELCR